jgi:hypothetical protein
MSKVTRVLGCTLLLALLATAAWAAPKHAPEVTPYNSHAGAAKLQLGSPRVNATCTLGELGTPAYIVNYVFPPDDQYYTFVDPSQCTQCNGVVSAVEGWAFLNFPATCTQQMSVAIYGAINNGGCWQVNTDQPLCPETVYDVTPPAAGNYYIGLPIPAGCCISQPAFLKITFVNVAAGCNSSSTIPRLITTGACNGCESYNIYPGGGPDDLCADIGFPGNPVMYLDVDCCLGTPTHKHTWGALKSTYR